MSRDLPMLPPDLKPVPAEHEDAWAKIQQRESAEPMRQALYLIAQGFSPTRAAKLVGYANGSRVHVYEKARHYGLYRPQAEQVAQQALEVAHISGDEMIRVLVEDPDQIDPKQLAVVWGIAQDKQIKRQQLQRGDHDTPERSLSDLAAEIVAQGGTLQLTVSGPGSTDPRTVTVEPDKT